MSFNDLMNEPVVTCRVVIEKTIAAQQYAEDPEPSHAIMFRRESVELDEIDDNIEIWLETAEDEEADEDLVLCGFHPIDEDMQVERLFYYRKSESGAKVYSLDVDGTAVPGTLELFCASFDCFVRVEDD